MVCAIPLMLILLVPNAFAHKLIDSDENHTYDTATIIPDVELSRAIYAELEPNKQNYYTFEGKQGDTFFGEIVVATMNNEASELEPKFAIIADSSSISKIKSQVNGQNPPCDLSHTMGSGCFYDTDTNFPYSVPSGYGALVFSNVLELPSEEFYEPFSMTEYSQRQTISFDIPSDSTYYIVTYSDELFDDNRYTLATGFIEDWSALDFVTLLPYYVIQSNVALGDYSLVYMMLFVGAIVAVAILKKKKFF
jgi:hypothetical protein